MDCQSKNDVYLLCSLGAVHIDFCDCSVCVMW